MGNNDPQKGNAFEAFSALKSKFFYTLAYIGIAFCSLKGVEQMVAGTSFEDYAILVSLAICAITSATMPGFGTMIAFLLLGRKKQYQNQPSGIGVYFLGAVFGVIAIGGILFDSVAREIFAHRIADNFGNVTEQEIDSDFYQRKRGDAQRSYDAAMKEREDEIKRSKSAVRQKYRAKIADCESNIRIFESRNDKENAKGWRARKQDYQTKMDTELADVSSNKNPNAHADYQKALSSIGTEESGEKSRLATKNQVKDEESKELKSTAKFAMACLYWLFVLLAFCSCILNAIEKYQEDKPNEQSIFSHLSNVVGWHISALFYWMLPEPIGVKKAGKSVQLNLSDDFLQQMMSPEFDCVCDALAVLGGAGEFPFYKKVQSMAKARGLKIEPERAREIFVMLGKNGYTEVDLKGHWKLTADAQKEFVVNGNFQVAQPAVQGNF